MLDEPRTTYLDGLTYHRHPNNRDWTLNLYAKGDGLHVVQTLGVNESLLLEGDLILLYRWDDPADMRSNLVGLVAQWLAPRIGIEIARADTVVANDLINHLYADLDALGLTDDCPWLMGYSPDAATLPAAAV